MKTNVMILIACILLMNTYHTSAQKTKDLLELPDLIDLSGFNLTVAGTRTVEDSMLLDNYYISIKDQFKKDQHFVIIKLTGTSDRDGAYVLSPGAFVAEYISNNSWEIQPASALGTTVELMSGKTQTFWVQNGVAQTLSTTGGKKGSDLNIEVLFILPRSIKAIKLGTTRFITESVTIN